MLEIVFDENASCEFLGQKCQMIDLEIPVAANWRQYRQIAQQLINNYAKQMAVIINLPTEGEAMNNLALALSVEAYDEHTHLESVVFKVKDSRLAMAAYKPFMALANSLRYTRDLLKLSEEERRADIKRLGYLGLKVKEDYIKASIEIDWKGIKPVKKFAADGMLAALVLVGVIKKHAICKDEISLHGVIGTDAEAGAEKISEPKDENEMIEKIIEYVRKNDNEN